MKKKVITGVVVLAMICFGARALYMAKKAEEKYTYKANRTPDCTSNLFGNNTYIFSPEDDPEMVNKILTQIWNKQETNQFGESRYAVYFMPGTYDESIAVKVGYYTQVAGLGELPTDTKIASLNCDARWLSDDPGNNNATCNFWRGVENLEVDSNTMWAVSQATFMRRVNIEGALYLHDNYGWCSGGFLSDSKVKTMIDSGSQQQWLSRNNEYKKWMDENWNMVFLGEEEGSAPAGTWPGKAYTTVETTPVIQEKPFLIHDEKEGFMVFVPTLRKDATGISWQDGKVTGEKLTLDQFYIATPKDTAQNLNAALSEGKHLLFTPGIYLLDEALRVERANTILLGMGLATLQPTKGNACVETANVEGLKIAGILFDAGEMESENLLVVGEEGCEADYSDNPICLSDVFFRVGGAASSFAAKVKKCVTVNSNDVIGDNFWVWRADHGANVAWNKNTAANGLVVNGDDVTMYALMVEHFLEYQTIWNGENGKVVMYQSEMPYDVPSQKEWQSHDGQMNGYASFYVDEEVDNFEAWGIGIYSYHRDAIVEAYCAMEIPDKDNVKVHNACAIMITGNPGISHVINDAGGPSYTAGTKSIIVEYANGMKK